MDRHSHSSRRNFSMSFFPSSGEVLPKHRECFVTPSAWPPACQKFSILSQPWGFSPPVWRTWSQLDVCGSSLHLPPLNRSQRGAYWLEQLLCLFPYETRKATGWGSMIDVISSMYLLYCLCSDDCHWLAHCFWFRRSQAGEAAYQCLGIAICNWSKASPWNSLNIILLWS